MEVGDKNIRTENYRTKIIIIINNNYNNDK